MVTRKLSFVLAAITACFVTASGCGLSPATISKGVDGGLGGSSGDGGADAGSASCPRAYVVTDSDYESTNVSIVSAAGDVLTASVVSSASSPPGLAAALSGDVVLPLARPASGDVVLIDRTNDAIDWIDPTTAAVKAQLSVATGFQSDPQDYLEVSATKAYVTRYLDDSAPGKQAYDEGGDVLVIDLTKHAVTGRIDLSESDDGALWPRPYRMLPVNGQVWVSLERQDATYATSGDARILGIDPSTDARTFVLDLPGVISCGGLALSPSGKVAAAACQGPGQEQTDVASAGIVLLDATKSPPVVLKTIPTTKGGIVAPTIAFASETRLVTYLYGDLTIEPSRDDMAVTVDTTTGTITPLVDAGGAFVLGDVKCAAMASGCAGECVMADAHANGVRFWSIESSGALTSKPTVSVDPAIGLPPRGLGEL